MFDSPFANTKRLRHKGHIYRLKKKPKPHKAWARSINLSLKKFAALPKTELLTGWNISPCAGEILGSSKPGMRCYMHSAQDNQACTNQEHRISPERRSHARLLRCGLSRGAPLR